MKSPVELESIFEGVPPDRRIVLIEGAPGAGKSSLSLNICKKWSEGEMFQEFKIVILVRLRDPCIQKAKSISEILPYCEKSISKKVESFLKETSGEDVLWVLDGWDEFPDQLKKDSKCLVRNLIYKQNHNSSVVVTSRPTSSVGLHPVVSKRIEILGFTSDELRQYFVHRLKGDTKSVDLLLEKIKEYPEVQSSCYLPLHAGFIADTFLTKQQDLPSTQYGIFETVIVKCISRHQIKQHREEISSLENLPDDVHRNFQAICELAYKGSLENKIIFTDSDLPAGFKSLDLLQEVESAVAFRDCVSKTYNFLHLSVQEFLAAQQLAKRPQYEQYWLFRGLMEDDRCLPMLTFYAAKTKLSAPGIADFVSKVGDRYFKARSEHEQEQLCGLLSFVFKCICETEDPSLCVPLVKALSGNFFKLSHIYDYYSLGSFLSLSSQCAEIGDLVDIGAIERSSVQDYEWSLFVKGLTRFYKGNCESKLATSTLQVNEPSDPILSVLQDTQLLKLSKLYIYGPQEEHIERLRRKRSRSVSGRPASKDYSSLLGNFISHASTLSSLHITSIRCTFTVLAEGLKGINTNLRELHLVDCSVDFKSVCRGLHTNKTLQVLNLSRNPMADGARYITDALTNSGLTELNLSNCSMKLLDLEEMNGFGSLKTLVLSGNTIGNKGAQYLASALKRNHTLKTLLLGNCGITSHGSACLLKVFPKGALDTLQISSRQETYTTVLTSSVCFYGLDSRVLKSEYFDTPDILGRQSTVKMQVLQFNEHSCLEVSVEKEGGQLLAQLFLQSNYYLQALVISSKDLDYETIDSIFAALESNTNLTFFHVMDGKMSTDSLRTLGHSLGGSRSLITVLIDLELVQYSRFIPAATPTPEYQATRYPHYVHTVSHPDSIQSNPFYSSLQ